MLRFLMITILALGVYAAPVQAATKDNDMSEMYNRLHGMVRSLQSELDVLLVKRGDANLCLNFSKNMKLGSRDQDTTGEVSALQKFLVQTGHLSSDSVTGYFGPKTQKAVQTWQAGKGLVTSGTPETTGFGVVGTTTRGSLAKACSQMSIETAATVDPKESSVDITNVTNSRNPVITGTVRNARMHRVVVYSGVNTETTSLADDDIVYSSDKISKKEIKIKKNRWWDTVEASLEDGQYTLDVYFSPKGSSKESHLTETFTVSVVD